MEKENNNFNNFAAPGLVGEIRDNTIEYFDSDDILCNKHCIENQPDGMQIKKCGSKECTALQVIARLTVKGYDCIFTKPKPIDCFLIQLTNSGDTHEWFFIYYSPNNFCVEFLPVELFDFAYELKACIPVGDAWKILMYGCGDE